MLVAVATSCPCVDASPPLHQLVHDKEINAEDEQVFLMKQQVGSPAHLFVNDPSCSPPQHGKHYFHPSHVLNEAAICTGNISFFLKSLLAKQPATPTRGANVSLSSHRIRVEGNANPFVSFVF